MNLDNESLIADAIDAAEEIQGVEAIVSNGKPRLLVDDCNPNETVSQLCTILSKSRDLFERGAPVRLICDPAHDGMVAHLLTPDYLVMIAHTLCRPYVLRSGKAGVFEADARLPKSMAVMYLDSTKVDRGLPPLNGIATVPLLKNDGSIIFANGYNSKSGMWCERLSDLRGLVPEQPTKDNADTALLLIRETFRTFCFADADMMDDGALGVPVVDISKPPGRDESGFLAALLTAVCRPSLERAPGFVLRAASLSGSGTGKGLLARAICLVAFGSEPYAVTAGGTAQEFEKRIAAELIGGGPVLFLDNLNDTTLRSDLLASVLTESLARVRRLGRSQMLTLSAPTFVILNGNGLTISEDLTRRLVEVELDAHMEDPEARPFRHNIRDVLKQRRQEILAACLTIWRWGRSTYGIEPGMPLGSFEAWCQWVRDPLLALGCHDPVRRIRETKARDGRRQHVAELFETWWQRHRDTPVLLSQLHSEVLHLLDPQGRNRQYAASRLRELNGTRTAGYMLTSQAGSGRWGKATYALRKTAANA